MRMLQRHPDLRIIIKFSHPPWFCAQQGRCQFQSNCCQLALAGLTVQKTRHGIPHRDHRANHQFTNKYEIAALTMKSWQKVTSGLRFMPKYSTGKYCSEVAGTLMVQRSAVEKRPPVLLKL